MSRQDRKNRTDIEYKGCGGISDALDDAMKQIWCINDAEFDYICEHATDAELVLFLGGNGKFSEMKQALEIVDNYLIKRNQDIYIKTIIESVENDATFYTQIALKESNQEKQQELFDKSNSYTDAIEWFKKQNN